MDAVRVEKLSSAEAARRGMTSWDIWEKQPSEFDWAYTSEEHCYVIEGSARISYAGKSVSIREGDYVVFPVGLKCRWKVIRPLRKHYNFQ